MPEMTEDADSEKAQEVAEEPKQEAEAGEAEPAQDSAPQEQSWKCAPPNAMFL